MIQDNEPLMRALIQTSSAASHFNHEYAGRMQDNEPLMRALSNLICTNNPELVLFVGEALVGNDAVDQLTKFNQRLLDLATSAQTKPHAIDGILLTKFDTIDDKARSFPGF